MSGVAGRAGALDGQGGRLGVGVVRSLAIVLSPYWRLFLVVIGSGILNQGAAIGAAAMGALLVGEAATGVAPSDMAPALILLALFVLVRAVMAWIEMWIAHDLAYRILGDFRVRVYTALERLAPAYLLERRSGDVAATAMSDVEVLEWFYAHTAGSFIVAAVVVVLTLVSLACIQPLLALVLSPWLVLVGTVPLWLSAFAARQGDQLRAELGQLHAEIVDSIQGLREIMAFGHGPRQTAKIDQHARGLIRAQRAYGSRYALEGATTFAFTAFGMVTVLATSAWLVTQGRLDPRLFPVSVVIAAFIFAPILEITTMGRRMGLVGAATRRLFTLLDEPASVKDLVREPPAAWVEPRIAFENASFRYRSLLPDAVTAVSFEIGTGETVALVGQSGAGKSTCAHLLLRFWDVAAGRIAIGGHDIRSFPQESLRQLVSFVPQDIYLFNMSLRENIRLGKPAATDADIEDAARRAAIHEFIAALPEGYDTHAGERGSQMSGGQRQRVAIARAFLKDAPILVMDEAVSNLDTENERALQGAIKGLQQGRTVLIIAHRLSTIRSADRVVMLADGRVVDMGSHADLIRKDGPYQRLIAAQDGAPSRPQRTATIIASRQ